jgi:hypothetical protein
MGLLALSVVISSSAFTDKAVALFSRLTCWNGGAIASCFTKAIALRFCCKLRSAMTSEVIYPHIEKANNQPARLQRIPRVRVAQIVMDYLAYGWSVEEMCRQHPYLTLSEAHAAMVYYFDRQDEIDSEIRTEWEQAQQAQSQASPSPCS